MRVDFYQLGNERVEGTIPLLARKVREAGQRLLVVSADKEQLGVIGKALWAQGREAFLANGLAGEPHDTRQPILLSGDCRAVNGARMVMFADGVWRDEGFGFERAFLLFGEAGLQAARASWRMLGERVEVERHIWKHEDGRWREGA